MSSNDNLSKKLLISYLSAVYQCTNKYLNYDLILQSQVPEDVLLALKKSCELSETFRALEDEHSREQGYRKHRNSEETETIISKMALAKNVQEETPTSLAGVTQQLAEKIKPEEQSCLPSAEEIQLMLTQSKLMRGKAAKFSMFKAIHTKVLKCFRNDVNTMDRFSKFAKSFREWNTPNSMYNTFYRELTIMNRIKQDEMKNRHSTVSSQMESEEEKPENEEKDEVGLGFESLKYDKKLSKRKNQTRLSTLIHTFYDEEHDDLIECLLETQSTEQCVRQWQSLFIPVSSCFCVDHMESCLNVDLRDFAQNGPNAKTNSLGFIDCATLKSECNSFMEQIFHEQPSTTNNSTSDN